MRWGSAAIVSMALAGSAAPVAAQEINARVGKLESEMRAVQRKVFPGGAGSYVEPEIAPASDPQPSGPGAPASSPVADLSQRVSALETQMQQLTSQQEQNQYRLRQLEDQFNAYRRTTDARLAAGAGASAGVAAAPPSDDGDTPPPLAPRTTRPPAGGSTATSGRPVAGTGSTIAPVRPAPASDTPEAAASGDPARAQRVAALQKPATGDAAEDSYLYGYRLWAAKLYPEAETQLKQTVATYPQSKRASYAQNLLGRSYLDEGKLNLASVAFYDNYKKFPDGERAPDSLYFLAQSLMKLNKPADACKVYSELTDVYAAKISPEMKANVAKGRVTAKCP